MRERIVRELRKAAALSQADASRWRELRDRLGDIAISTIDAFCLSLLREFPLESIWTPVSRWRTRPRCSLKTRRWIGRSASGGLAASDEHVAFVLARLGETRRAPGSSPCSSAGRGRPGSRAVPGAGAGGPDVGHGLRPAAEGVRRALDLVPGGRERFLADGPVASARFALLASDSCRSGRVGPPSSLRAALDRLAQHVLHPGGKPRQRFVRCTGRRTSRRRRRGSATWPASP